MNRYISLASKAFKLASFVASVVNPEVKTKETVLSGTYGITPTIQLLTDVDIGDGPHDRNGNSVKTKDMIIRGSWSIPVFSESDYHTCKTRIVIVVDTQSQGTPPTAAEIFDTSAANYLDAPRQTDTQVGNRFRHLADIRQTLTVGGGQLKDFKIYRNLGHHIHWSGSNGTDELAGNIWAVIMSNQNTNPPQLEFNSRVSYYDN